MAYVDVPLPPAVTEALNKLSNELTQTGLRLTSIEIKRAAKPYVNEYTIYTAGGAVKVKQEL